MVTKKYNKKAEWINNLTRELEGLEEGPKAEINIDLLKTTQKISNGKTPGNNGIHGFWLKKFTNICDRLALEMNRYLQRAHVPEWMTKGKKKLIDSKGTVPNNYRPMTCLPMIWKILAAHIIEEIYNLLFLREKEKMSQWIQRHNRVTLHRSSSSSSHHAISTDIPDPLSPPFSIVHCFR